MLIINQFFIIRRYTLSSDSVLSSGQQILLREFLNKEILNKKFCRNIVQMLHNQFPWISACSLRLKASGALECIIKAAPPIAHIDNFLLLANNAVVFHQTYNEYSTQGLPLITRSAQLKNEPLPYAIIILIKKIPEFIFETYDLKCISEKEIHLTDKSEPKFIVIADQDSLPTLNINKCNAARNEIATKKEAFKKGYWFADIRFKNQVVVHSQQERIL